MMTDDLVKFKFPYYYDYKENKLESMQLIHSFCRQFTVWNHDKIMMKCVPNKLNPLDDGDVFYSIIIFNTKTPGCYKTVLNFRRNGNIFRFTEIFGRSYYVDYDKDPNKLVSVLQDLAYDEIIIEEVISMSL